MPNRISDPLDFQAQALGLRSERQRLIASNIANADTPGYVARDLNFGQALKEATIRSLWGTAARVRYRDATRDIHLTKGAAKRLNASLT